MFLWIDYSGHLKNKLVIYFLNFFLIDLLFFFYYFFSIIFFKSAEFFLITVVSTLKRVRLNRVSEGATIEGARENSTLAMHALLFRV